METEMQYTEKTFYVSGVKVTVRRPILSPEERRKREQEIITALINYDKSLQRSANGG